MKNFLLIVVMVIEMILSTICEAQETIVFKAQYESDSLLREVLITSTTEIFQCEVNCPRNLKANIENGTSVHIPICDRDGQTPFQDLEGEFTRFFVVTLNGKTYYIENLPELNIKKKGSGILYHLGRTQTIDSITVFDPFLTFNLKEGKYSYQADGGIHIPIPERDTSFTVEFVIDGVEVKVPIKPKK